MKKQPFLIVHAPQDFWGLMMGLIALMGIAIIRNTYLTTLPKFANDTLYLLLGGGLALIGIVLCKLLYQVLAKDKNCDPRWIRFSYEQEKSKKKSERNLFDAGDFRTDTILCIVIYFLIQAVMFILGESAYQVSAVDKVLFYVFAAIVEELIYRGILVMSLQTIFALGLKIKDKTRIIPINILTILISGVTFMASHKNYYGDWVKLTITFLGGCSQAFWYLRDKSLLMVELSHGLINLANAGSFMQGVAKTPTEVIA